MQRAKAVHHGHLDLEAAAAQDNAPVRLLRYGPLFRSGKPITRLTVEPGGPHVEST